MIEVQARERVIVFTGHGEWDLATAPALRAQLEVALAGVWQVVAIDLRDVSFMDVAGVSPILHALRRSQTTGQEVMLIYPRPQVARLLDVLGLAALVMPSEAIPSIGQLVDALNDLASDDTAGPAAAEPGQVIAIPDLRSETRWPQFN